MNETSTPENNETLWYIITYIKLVLCFSKCDTQKRTSNKLHSFCKWV